MTTPQIRFEGFDGGWVVSELAKFGTLQGGGTPATEVQEYWNGGIPWFTPAEISKTGSGILSHSVRTISEAGLRNSSAKILPPGSLLITSRASIGHVAITNCPSTTNQGFASLAPRFSNQVWFIYYWVLNNQDLMERLAGGSTFLEISARELARVEVKHPQVIEEQEAIGNYFNNLDEIIEVGTAKLKNLRNLKQSMLVKMFPQAGSNVPEIRFEGFDGEWDDVEIASVASRDYGGGTPPTTQREFWGGSIPWIQSSDLKVGETTAVNPTKHITPEAIKHSATSLVPGNSLAVVTRVGVGKIAAMPFPYTTSQDFISLTGLVGDISFLGIAIQQAILRDINQLQGSTIKGMTRHDVLSKRLYVPSSAEQEAIGNYFSNLDNLIRLEEEKLNKLKNLKNSFLNKMFV